MCAEVENISGLGFRVNVDEKDLKNFILKHEKTIEKLYDGTNLVKYTRETPSEAYDPKYEFSEWENGANNYVGIYGMVADVMTKETGITFEYIEDLSDDKDDVIIFSNDIPWQTENTKKSIEIKEIEKICNEYIDDLGSKLKYEPICIEFMN